MSKEKDKVTLITSTKTIDFTSGEITEQQEITHIKKSVEPNYIKLYINTLLTFKDLPKSLNPILIELLGYMSYANSEDKNGGQKIYINASMKKEIMEKLGLKMNTIDKALGNFVKSNIFKRIDIGVYQVNPHLFGKGEWREISSIRANFDFNTGEAIATIE